MSNIHDLRPGTPEYEEAEKQQRASLERLNALLAQDAARRVQLDREAERMGMSTRDLWVRKRQEEWDLAACRKALDEGKTVVPSDDNPPAFLAAKEWRAPEVKVSKQAGETFAVLEGYASTFGPPADSYGDVVQRGAFARTLKEKVGRKILYPLLASHRQEVPIGGIVAAKEDIYGLRVTALLDLDTTAGREAYSGIQKGYLTGLSIGYRTLKDHYDGGNRVLDDITLYEASLVSLPANERAKVLTANLVKE